MIFEDLQTTLLIIGAGIAIVILLWLLLRKGWRRQSLKPEERAQIEQERAETYAASKERPYVRAETPPPPASPPAAPPIAPAEPVAADRTEPESAPAVEPRAPAPETLREEDESGVAQPAVPLPGDLAGIAFPPGAVDHSDELTKLKGVGPKLEALLNEEGITRYEQLASLDDAELAALEDRLGTFKGRLTRDRVVEQARLLASGDREEFEARFGRLGSG